MPLAVDVFPTGRDKLVCRFVVGKADAGIPAAPCTEVRAVDPRSGEADAVAVGRDLRVVVVAVRNDDYLSHNIS